MHWDKLARHVGAATAALLREFRRAIEDAFPGRLDALVLLPDEIAPPTTNLSLIAFIDRFDAHDDGARLRLLAEASVGQAFVVALIGQPSDHKLASPELLARCDDEGTPVPGPEGMTASEFYLWIRDEPDTHELIEGQPVRMSDEKQASRRIMRALLAAATASGDIRAGQDWLERPYRGLGDVPLELAAESWRGLACVLRVLAELRPGCTTYDPTAAPFRLGSTRIDLLADAERRAALAARNGGHARC